MRFAYALSFHKTTEALSPAQAARLLKAVKKFESGWEKGEVTRGVGLTHLRGDFYEFRAGIRERVIFRRSGDLIYYLKRL